MTLCFFILSTSAENCRAEDNSAGRIQNGGGIGQGKNNEPLPSPDAEVKVPAQTLADTEKNGKAVQDDEESREVIAPGPADTVKIPSKPPIRLFGTVEFRSIIKNLPKWERVLAEEQKHPTFTEQGIDTDNKKLQERWLSLKAKLKDAPIKEKLQGVTNFFNQWPYKTDNEVWGVEDYWATPREFFNKSGDCEDFAISKFYALINLGVPPELMRIAAVKDGIRGLGHAVLVVFVDDDAYILDNITNLVLSHKRLTHYSPQFTVNEEYLWRHVKPKPGTGK
ncbi:MAG: transglutaminase-like cysteine peptidase [Desulfovibrio sp.]|nr:transglutaminase-like cysteine peptidase [Desulfovibrio sp.]